jgi:hypothetical protein
VKVGGNEQTLVLMWYCTIYNQSLHKEHCVISSNFCSENAMYGASQFLHMEMLTSWGNMTASRYIV